MARRARLMSPLDSEPIDFWATLLYGKWPYVSQLRFCRIIYKNPIDGRL